MPRKNLQLIGGVSLIQRAVNTCRAAKLVSETYVSTEDQEIAQQAAYAGATVIQRPWDLATDEADSHAVLVHGLQQIEPQPAVLVWVQCTAPLMTAAEIDGCIKRLIETGADVCIAAAEFHGGIMRESYDGRMVGVNWDMEGGLRRRQDAVKQWQVAGSVWAMDVRKLLRRGRSYSHDCVIYPVPRAVDVDSPADLDLAAALLGADRTPISVSDDLRQGYPL